MNKMLKIDCNMKKKLKLKILLLSLVIATSLSACVSYDVDINALDNYLVNKRTLKIHALDCDAINLMSEHNKMEVYDSIAHLVEEGNIICEKCKARKKTKFLGLFESPFGKEEYTVDLEELPSKEEYLKAISTIGEWYINHVPTYQGKLKEEMLAEYRGNDKNYKIYNLISKTFKTKFFVFDNRKDYIVVSTDSNANKLEALAKDTNISMAKEEAVLNYKDNYNNIDIKSSQSYYPCEYIDDSKDSYVKAGDDCVRFFFSVMNSFDKGFTHRLSGIVGKKWSRIDTNIFHSNRGEIVRAMVANGFDVYDSFGSTENGVNIVQISNAFMLMPGDIIVRSGHLHIYLGRGYGLSDNFGWGKVNRIFPQRYNYNLKSDENNHNYIVCDKDIDADGTHRKYTKVYRYKGGGRR